MQTDLNEVSRLAALRQHPEVVKALEAFNARDLGWWEEEFDALLSAVAAAATAQTRDECAKLCDAVAARFPGAGNNVAYGANLCGDSLRALAGGAPAGETQGVSDERE